MSNWLITIPRQVSWATWMGEVADAKAKGLSLFYRISRPFKCYEGDRCFVLHDGKVRGWLPIVGVETRDMFFCQTTGKKWLPGTFLVRKPEFHPVDGPELRGFQGVRRLPMNFLEAILNKPR